MSAQRKGRISSPTAKTGERIIAPENSDESSPTWCFAHLRKFWHVDGLERDEKVMFLDSLVKRSSLNWKQIKVLDRKKLGFEAINGGDLKDSIPRIAEGQVIFCFRIGDAGRFLGVRNDDTFHIIWIDFKFRLYNH